MKTSQSMHSISTHMSLPSELAHDHFLSSSNFSVSQSFSEVKCHNTSRYACIYCFHGIPDFESVTETEFIEITNRLDFSGVLGKLADC